MLILSPFTTYLFHFFENCPPAQFWRILFNSSRSELFRLFLLVRYRRSPVSTHSKIIFWRINLPPSILIDLQDTLEFVVHLQNLTRQIPIVKLNFLSYQQVSPNNHRYIEITPCHTLQKLDRFLKTHQMITLDPRSNPWLIHFNCLLGRQTRFSNNSSLYHWTIKVLLSSDCWVVSR